MKSETINRIQVLDTGELLLGLESSGQPVYQHIYRAAAGVSWDQDKSGFKSTPMKERSCSQWFKQIVDAVRSELGVELKLGSDVIWLNVPAHQKTEIQREAAVKNLGVRHMIIDELTKELKELVEEFGTYPYDFFNILQNSDNPNLDLDTQNKQWEFIKEEAWHNLDMKDYLLWSVSDNGDLLWWNGEQTIAMNHRAGEFMSMPVQPGQFIRLIGMGNVTGIFPSSLWDENT